MIYNKRYHLLNVSLDNRVSFFSALSESRRLLLRSLSLVDRRSLASAVSEPRQFLVACLGVWIIVSPLPPLFLRRDASSTSLVQNYGAPSPRRMRAIGYRPIAFRSQAIFLRGRKKGHGIICSRMREIPRIRVDIFRVLSRSLPLYSRIYTTDDG